MIQHLEMLIASTSFVGKSFTASGKTYTVAKADNFSYVDPIDNSVAKNQVYIYGIFVLLHSIEVFFRVFEFCLRMVPD